MCLDIIALESAGRYCSVVSMQNSYNRYNTVSSLLHHRYILSVVQNCWDTIRFFNRDVFFTAGIRRFIRELEIDGKLYELRLRQQYPGQNVHGDPQLQLDGKDLRQGMFSVCLSVHQGVPPP